MWFHNIIPKGYALATLTLEGRSPLLMNSGEADPESELYRAYFLLGQKRGKSLDDEAHMREMEWQLRLYLDDEIGPYLPTGNLKELLRSSATKWRKGEEIKRSLIFVETRVPLQYDGPRDQQGLWDARTKKDKPRYRDIRMVANAGAGSGRVRRCRPMFEEWTIKAELAYDPADLDFDFLEKVVERSRKYGLGDGRAIGFGQFEAELVLTGIYKGSANGSAAKSRDEQGEAAHAAVRERIMSVKK